LNKTVVICGDFFNEQIIFFTFTFPSQRLLTDQGFLSALARAQFIVVFGLQCIECDAEKIVLSPGGLQMELSAKLKIGADVDVSVAGFKAADIRIGLKLCAVLLSIFANTAVVRFIVLISSFPIESSAGQRIGPNIGHVTGMRVLELA